MSQTYPSKIAFQIVGLFFMAAVVTAAFVYRKEGLISEVTFYLTLLFSLALYGLIGFGSNLMFLKLSKLEIRFREIKETENSVKDLAATIVDLSEATVGGSYVDETFDADAYESALTRLKSLVGKT